VTWTDSFDISTESETSLALALQATSQAGKIQKHNRMLEL
jgi:hypothetical protein